MKRIFAIMMSLIMIVTLCTTVFAEQSFCDLNERLDSYECKDVIKTGYEGVIRYVGRDKLSSYDLNKTEVETILNSGLELGVVQHCPLPPWKPSTKPTSYKWGSNAVEQANYIGYPKGNMIALDLEGLKMGTPKKEIIDFCNKWYKQVEDGGYQPVIYIGYDVFISGSDAYYKLKFENYWGAYNVNITPVKRGYSIKQKLQKWIGGNLKSYVDPNVVKKDKLGGYPEFASKYDKPKIIIKKEEKKYTYQDAINSLFKDNIIKSPEFWKDIDTKDPVLIRQYIKELFNNYLIKK